MSCDAAGLPAHLDALALRLLPLRHVEALLVAKLVPPNESEAVHLGVCTGAACAFHHHHAEGGAGALYSSYDPYAHGSGGEGGVGEGGERRRFSGSTGIFTQRGDGEGRQEREKKKER